MPKKPKHFSKITFDWVIPSEDRYKIEEYLRHMLGYEVDGGRTDLIAKTATIFIRPKARSHKRRVPTSPPPTEAA